MGRYNKWIVTAVAFIAEVVNLNVFTGRTQDILSGVVVALNSVLVYAIPNYVPAVRTTNQTVTHS